MKKTYLLTGFVLFLSLPVFSQLIVDSIVIREHSIFDSVHVEPENPNTNDSVYLIGTVVIHGCEAPQFDSTFVEHIDTTIILHALKSYEEPDSITCPAFWITDYKFYLGKYGDGEYKINCIFDFFNEDSTVIHRSLDSLNVKVQNSNSIPEFDFNDDLIHIYPNPLDITSDLTIESESSGKVTIYSAQGVLMEQKKILRGNNAIRLNTLPKGIYFFKIESSNVKSVKKIIKN